MTEAEHVKVNSNKYYIPKSETSALKSTQSLRKEKDEKYLYLCDYAAAIQVYL